MLALADPRTTLHSVNHDAVFDDLVVHALTTLHHEADTHTPLAMSADLTVRTTHVYRVEIGVIARVIDHRGSCEPEHISSCTVSVVLGSRCIVSEQVEGCEMLIYIACIGD